MYTKVKICGIKTIEEINIINQYPLDYMGFIFAESKRRVSIEKAIALKAQLNNSINPVGVFVNEGEAFIQEAIKKVGLYAVQLHGEISSDVVARLMQQTQSDESTLKEVWRTIAVKDEAAIEQVKKIQPTVTRVLLDTYHRGKTGGTGIQFNWNLLNSINTSEVIIAGGLTPENVASCIKQLNPYLVDMNSGLETDLIKDETKIKKAFVAINSVTHL